VIWYTRGMKSFLAKYSAIFNIALTRSFTYRAETTIWILLDIFPTFITMLVWIAIYKGATHAMPISISQLLIYYFALLLIGNLAGTHFEEEWVDQVKYGKVDSMFTKPLDFVLNMVVVQLSGKLLALITFLVPAGILLSMLFSLGTLHLPTLNAVALATFALFVLLTFAMNCVLSALVVLAAFWFDESRSLAHFKWILDITFGGGIAPLIFYPHWIQTIAKYLPFSRMGYVPATLLSSETVNAATFIDLFVLAGFVLAGMYVVRVVWNMAARKYTSAGG
jgi:ABC-2 type transport system permease protein